MPPDWQKFQPKKIHFKNPHKFEKSKSIWPLQNKFQYEKADI